MVDCGVWWVVCTAPVCALLPEVTSVGMGMALSDNCFFKTSVWSSVGRRPDCADAPHTLGRRKNSSAHALFLRRLFGSISILALVAAVPQAYAGGVTGMWSGAGGADWSTDSNWSWSNQVPTSADEARVDSDGPLIASGTTAHANSLLVGLGNAGTLVVNGTLETGGATLGYSGSSSGTITVSGPASQWTNTEGLSVGGSGTGTVALNNGAVVTSGTTYLGAVAGGSGTLTVDGKSSLTTNGTLFVGFGGATSGTGGHGTLTITSGIVNSRTAILADGMGTTGTAAVSGSDSSWNNTGDMFVGGGGVATLSVNGGGRVGTAAVYIGHLEAGGTSKLTVEGSGSSFVSTGALTVGSGGKGELWVESAATVTSGSAIIGRHSLGLATIRDSGSQWTTGALVVGGDSSDAAGPAGNGTLSIRSGGAVTSTSGMLGDTVDATGSVVVDGAGSSWSLNGGRIGVGTYGTGKLTVQNAGAITSGSSILGWYGGSYGEAMISGAGSSWTNAEALYVGNEGNGALTIESGGRVASTYGYVANASTSGSSKVTIDGTGSIWDMSGLFIAGNIAGTKADVTIKNGGTLRAVQGTLGNLAGSYASMTVTGSGSSWSAYDDGVTAYAAYMNVGLDGTGDLSVLNGGAVSAYRLYIGNNVGSSGTVVVRGAGSSITTTDRLYIGAEGDGTLTLSDEASISASRINIAYLDGASGTLNIGAATGQTAVAAGAVNASEIFFGAGDGRIVLNHTGTNYELASAISGSGRIIAENGTTTLSGANTYTGGTTITGGTLVGTATSFGTGAIVNNAALVVGGSGTLANSISGSGTVEKVGSGTLTLAGVNSYTGGTTISAGTLIASTTSLSGDVVNNATLIIDQDSDGTFGGNISGSGDLVKDGTGTVSLTGTLTYSGTTTILAGQLVGNTSTIGGPVTNSGQLEFNQTYDGSYSSIVSGSGSLLKTGSGTLTLTAANSYTGGTTISDGTLIGSAASFGSGAIVNNAALVVDGSGTLANSISGSGTFEKTGSGKLLLTGTSTYTGGTQITSGTLSVNGHLSSIVTVDSGATLGGSGSIGGLFVLSGGNLAPGNSIGTLTINGNASFASGSTYSVEVNSSGSSDQLVVAGTVNIANNVGLIVAPENHSDDGSTYALNTKYAIITSTGGVTGNFSSISENFAYLVASLSKSSDDKIVYLTLDRTNYGFADILSTRNAKAAAGAVESMGSSSSLYNTALYLQTSEAQVAFSQLSGEIHPSLGHALLDRSRLTRDVISNRIRDAFDTTASVPVTAYGESGITSMSPKSEALSFWASGFGGWSDYDGDGNAKSLTVNGGGGLFGADVRVGNDWRFGVASGYGRDSLSQSALNASANIDSDYLSAYGGADIGPASVTFGAVHAFQTVETQRSVSFSGLSEDLSAHYDAATTQIFAEAAWRFDFDLTHIEPYANLAYVHTHTDSFTETGGLAALSSRAADYDQVYSTLGARVSRDIAVENMLGRASLGLGWRRAYDDLASATTLSFANSAAFSVASQRTARDAMLVDFSVGFDLRDNTNVTLGYSGSFGNGLSEQAASVKLGVKF